MATATADPTPKPKKDVPPRPCGFCSTGHHDRCPGAIRHRGNELWFCGCGCAQSKQVRCLECKSTTAELIGWHCADKTACDGRREERRRHYPIYQFILEMEQRAEVASGDGTSAPRAPRAPRQDRPTSGTCRCCGEATRGGSFLPGHDARFVGRLAEMVQTKTGEWTRETALRALEDKPKLQAKLTSKLDKMGIK